MARNHAEFSRCVNDSSAILLDLMDSRNLFPFTHSGFETLDFAIWRASHRILLLARPPSAGQSRISRSP